MQARKNPRKMLDFRGRGVNVADWRHRRRHPPRARTSTRPGKFFRLRFNSPLGAEELRERKRNALSRRREDCAKVAKIGRGPPHSDLGGSSCPFAPREQAFFSASSASSAGSAVLHTCSEMFHNVRANQKVEQMDRENVPQRSAAFPDVPKCSQNAVFAKRTHRKRKRANRSSPLGRSLGCLSVETNPPPLYISRVCTSSA